MKHYSFILILFTLLTACSPGGSEWKTGQLLLKLSDKGFVTALSDPASGKNYLASGQPAPLMQIRAGGVYLSPVAAKVDASGKVITLTFDGHREAKILIEAKPTHLVLKLAAITGADSLDLIVWGPYPTPNSKTNSRASKTPTPAPMTRLNPPIANASVKRNRRRWLRFAPSARIAPNSR